MPVYKDQKTGRLYIEFQFRGERYKERLPAKTTKADAEILEIKLKNDRLMAAHGIATKRLEITFEVFLREYFGPHIEKRYSAASFEKAVYVTKAALPFFKGKPMRSVKARDIERFKQSRIDLQTLHGTTRQPATVERELSIISSIFALAVKNDVCEYNPCSRVEKLRFDNVQDKLLRREDEAKFFENMHSPWARDVCLMALYTGLRQNDIMNLTRFDVKLNENCIRLTQGKTKRRIEIRLNAISREVIESRWHNGNRLLFPSPATGNEKGSVRHAIQRACQRAEITILTIRDLRRTFATRVIEDGADAVTAAAMLGHGSLRMIPRYVRSIELQQKAADKLASPASTKNNIVPLQKSRQKKG